MGCGVDFYPYTLHHAHMTKHFALTLFVASLLAWPAGAASFNIAGGGSSGFNIQGNTSSNRYSGASDLNVSGNRGNRFIVPGGNIRLDVQGDTSDFRTGDSRFNTDGYGYNLSRFGTDTRFNVSGQNRFQVRQGSSSFDVAGRTARLRTDGTQRLEVRGSRGDFNVRGGSSHFQASGGSNRFHVYR